MKRRLQAAVLIASTLMTGCESSAKGTTMRLFDFISAVAALPSLQPTDVETLLGQPFGKIDENAYFTRYRLERVRIDDRSEARKVELRAPKPGGGASSGGLLNMEIGGQCVDRAAVAARYPSMRLIDSPRGRREGEEFVYELRDSRRAVRFGFSPAEPLCLTGLSFEFAP